MDYEKKYKEALEKARKTLEKSSAKDEAKLVVEYFFPELAESEDEKIRRTLVEYFGPQAQLDFIRGVPIQKIRDWLEKQKINTEGDFGRGYDCGYQAGYSVAMNEMKPKVATATLDSEKQKEPHYTKHNALFDKCVENCDPKTVEEVNKRVDDIINMPELSPFEQALTNFIGDWEDDEEHWPSQFVKKHGKHILDMAREELQKEQKPNIELIQRSWYMEGYHDREFGKEPKWVIKTGEGGPKHELNPRYGELLTEQRPTEEQLHNLNEAIKSFRVDGFDRIADSLHSLYNILKTQEQHPSSKYLPRDWVVYDGPLGHAILQVKDVVDGRYTFVDNESTLLVEDSDKFLRPLTPKDVEKPAEWSEEDEETIGTLINYFEGDALDYSTDEMIRRIRALRPSWKPSKEQLSMLLAVINDPNNAGAESCYMALNSIYNNLKKL